MNCSTFRNETELDEDQEEEQDGEHIEIEGEPQIAENPFPEESTPDHSTPGT